MAMLLIYSKVWTLLGKRRDYIYEFIHAICIASMSFCDLSTSRGYFLGALPFNSEPF